MNSLHYFSDIERCQPCVNMTLIMIQTCKLWWSETLGDNY